ncbi:MAG TPA: hypothetical protein PLT87_05595 [Spirochaetales bacterium]|nr:hypothetical protein [Spirochaetales bacterium]
MSKNDERELLQSIENGEWQSVSVLHKYVTGRLREMEPEKGKVSGNV